jgi:2-(1,2-epoxy-1,2-dihydrophenyl)acetyl-CoA isomerase
LRDFGSDEQSRVGIVTGSGKAFCAGGSLNELGEGLTAGAGVEYMKRLNEIILTIHHLEKPLIAAVNGAAVGAGFSMALACDIVIASENAIFSVAFPKVGLVPDLGGIYFLPRIAGLHKAKELYFTGETLKAVKAFEMGFVNHVTAPDELMAFSMKMAARISQGPPKAFAMGKALLNRSGQLCLEDVLAYEAMAQAISFQSEDHREGIVAFREKRVPFFCGK